MNKRSVLILLALLVMTFQSFTFCENASDKYPYLFESHLGDYYDIVDVIPKHSSRGFFINANILLTTESFLGGNLDCLVIFEKLPLSLFENSVDNKFKRQIAGKIDPNTEFITRISIVRLAKCEGVKARSKDGTKNISGELSLMPYSTAEDEAEITDKKGTEYDYLKVILSNGYSYIIENPYYEKYDDYIILRYDDHGDVSFANEVLDVLNIKYIKKIISAKDEDKFESGKIIFENTPEPPPNISEH